MPVVTLADPDLATAVGGRYIEPDLLVIEQQVDGDVWNHDVPDLGTHLQLVYGVGPRWAEQLRLAGYHTLDDLLGHYRFGHDATTCLAALVRRDAQALKARGAPVERILRLFTVDELAFLDIETMGLDFGQELLVVGVLRLDGGQWVLRQAAILSLSCQEPLLRAALALLDGALVCVTYNGAAFDIPFMRAAMHFHDVETAGIDRLFSADMVYPTHRHYREVLADCRLATVAANVLGITNNGDIPGELIPYIYGHFLSSRDPQMLRRILEHNRHDLIVLRDLTQQIVTEHVDRETANSPEEPAWRCR